MRLFINRANYSLPGRFYALYTKPGRNWFFVDDFTSSNFNTQCYNPHISKAMKNKKKELQQNKSSWKRPTIERIPLRDVTEYTHYKGDKFLNS